MSEAQRGSGLDKPCHPRLAKGPTSVRGTSPGTSRPVSSPKAALVATLGADSDTSIQAPLAPELGPLAHEPPRPPIESPNNFTPRGLANPCRTSPRELWVNPRRGGAQPPRRIGACAESSQASFAGRGTYNSRWRSCWSRAGRTYGHKIAAPICSNPLTPERVQT